MKGGSLKGDIHSQLNWAILLRDVMTDGKNWVNCEFLTGNSAGLRTVFSSRLSHRELRSSLRETHSFLHLPADTTKALSQNTHKTDKRTDIPDGKPVLYQKTYCSVFRAVFYTVQLYIWNEKSTNVTISILFIYRRISTCFGPTGPSSGEFTQLFTQPLVQCLYRSGRVLHAEHATWTVQTLNQWLCEQLCELYWRWTCEPETCRDPSIYE